VNFIISDTTVLGSGQDGIGVIGLGYAQSSIRGAITRVETSNNGGSGIDFFGHNRFAVVNLAVTDVNASFNNVGVTTAFTGNLALHRVVLTGNLTGLNAVNGGAVQTSQDDLIAYNGTNISGISLSPASNGLY